MKVRNNPVNIQEVRDRPTPSTVTPSKTNSNTQANPMAEQGNGTGTVVSGESAENAPVIMMNAMTNRRHYAFGVPPRAFMVQYRTELVGSVDLPEQDMINMGAFPMTMADGTAQWYYECAYWRREDLSDDWRKRDRFEDYRR